MESGADDFVGDQYGKKRSKKTSRSNEATPSWTPGVEGPSAEKKRRSPRKRLTKEEREEERLLALVAEQSLREYQASQQASQVSQDSDKHSPSGQ